MEQIFLIQELDKPGNLFSFTDNTALFGVIKSTASMPEIRWCYCEHGMLLARKISLRHAFFFPTEIIY